MESIFSKYTLKIFQTGAARPVRRRWIRHWYVYIIVLYNINAIAMSFVYEGYKDQWSSSPYLIYKKEFEVHGLNRKHCTALITW